MGRDKSRLLLGGRTMLSIIKAAAQATGLPVKVVRRDLVDRCGPLGGIFTGLKRSEANWILFLACDMPFVRGELLAHVVAQRRRSRHAVFVVSRRGAGFPFLVPRGAEPLVRQQIDRGAFSLQGLAQVLKAKTIRLAANWSSQLENVNTPERFEHAKSQW